MPKSFPGQELVTAPKGHKDAEAYKRFFESKNTKVCFMIEKDFVDRKFKETLPL